MRIALGQLEVVWGDWDGNAMRARTVVRDAAFGGARWVMLPEMWACGFPCEDLPRLASRTPELLKEVEDWARQWEVGVVGSLPEKTKRGIRNTAFLVRPEGIVGAKYRKIHLNRSLSEDRFLRPGDRPFVYASDGTDIGLMICDDVRFPELARRLVIRGAVMIWIPAHWLHPHLEHWRTLLRARAIENQVFVLAVNACGRQGELRFLGHSMAIDPSGDVMVEGGEEPDLLWVDMNMDRLREVREAWPGFDGRWPEMYSDVDSPSGGGKLLDDVEAATVLDKARSEGQTIVFTNGCFDLLHAGHVSYLERARELGDVLVVGINTDDSVRTIKGPQRPITPLEDRCRVLAGLSCVDVLVPFAEPDPHRLIAQLRPHVLVKGADWPEEEVVGGDLVKSLGGRVVRLPLREGVSTTEIVQKILGSYHPVMPEGG